MREGNFLKRFLKASPMGLIARTMCNISLVRSMNKLNKASGEPSVCFDLSFCLLRLMMMVWCKGVWWKWKQKKRKFKISKWFLCWLLCKVDQELKILNYTSCTQSVTMVKFFSFVVYRFWLNHGIDYKRDRKIFFLRITLVYGERMLRYNNNTRPKQDPIITIFSDGI